MVERETPHPPIPLAPLMSSAAPSKSDLPFVVPWKERICYGLTDTASTMVLQAIVTYLLYFYTDVYGLSGGAVATLFLITRLFDVPTALGMGIVIDKTHTRWGQCRPYFLFLAAPFALLAVLTFYAAPFGAVGKVVYAYATYNAIMLVFTMINLPIAAMLPSMTNNPQERVEVSSTRMFLAYIGYTGVLYGMMPLVRWFGHGDKAKGFLYTMSLFGLIVFVCFILAFFYTRERFTPEKKIQPKIAVAVRSVGANRPWLLLLALRIVYWIGISVESQTTVYYLSYVVHRADMIPSLLLTSLATLGGIAACPLLSSKVGKRNTAIVGVAVFAFGIGLICCAGTSHIWLILLGAAVSNFGKGFSVGIWFAMLADTVDYGEWKTGVRASGLIFGASTVGTRLGIGAGGALSALILSASGYVPNAQQTATTLAAIKANFILIPIVCGVVQIAVLLFYRVDSRLPKILIELQARKTAQA
jgi:GPH family glycoside/pentoside/hexuronide:cation symporter